MEKYNAETMAIVPRKLTTKMADEFMNQWDSTGGRTITDNYKAALNVAPQVEPVVPLSEVLELLEAEAENSRLKGGMYVGIACSILIGAIKQKYGVSE